MQVLRWLVWYSVVCWIWLGTHFSCLGFTWEFVVLLYRLWFHSIYLLVFYYIFCCAVRHKAVCPFGILRRKQVSLEVFLRPVFQVWCARDLQVFLRWYWMRKLLFMGMQQLLRWVLYREFLCLFSVWHSELVRDFNRFRRSIMEQENIRGCARRFGLPYFLDWLIW